MINGAAVGLGAAVATSCIGVDYPLVAFRCDPRQEDNCPDTHFCCSDDPAAAEGQKPAYVGKNITNASTPYFSGDNNGRSRSGMCVRVDDIAGQGLAEPFALNCPIPCNPTWPEDWIDDVCGVARVCCQTVALETPDCISGDDGFRPVTGDDILAERTLWRPSDHATHQDPNGSGCQALAGEDMDLFFDCLAQLSVADQRGFCMALDATQACPTELPTFVDACTQLNGGGAPPA
ncbi:MAG: hypothetical protein AAGF11_33000 [Myxococcota bacterium]